MCITEEGNKKYTKSFTSDISQLSWKTAQCQNQNIFIWSKYCKKERKFTFYFLQNKNKKYVIEPKTKENRLSQHLSSSHKLFSTFSIKISAAKLKVIVTKVQNGFDPIVDAHLKAIWLDQVSELKPGALNKNFLRYASSNTNMKQKIR